MPMANESTFINNSMDGISHLHEGAYQPSYTPIKQPIPHFYMYDHPLFYSCKHNHHIPIIIIIISLIKSWKEEMIKYIKFQLNQIPIFLMVI